jgi:hypothetical protein
MASATIDPVAVMTERIEINPAVMLGKPVIRGTRIAVERVVRKLPGGADLVGASPAVSRGGKDSPLGRGGHDRSRIRSRLQH